MIKKIAIFDDDLDIAEIIKTILERYDYDTKIYSNSKKIKQCLKNFKPDLILLDIFMPGLSGKEIAKKIKPNKETNHIPIIAISGLNEISNISKKIGADDYLAKPFEMDELLKIVKKYLE